LNILKYGQFHHL